MPLGAKCMDDLVQLDQNALLNGLYFIAANITAFKSASLSRQNICAPANDLSSDQGCNLVTSSRIYIRKALLVRFCVGAFC